MADSTPTAAPSTAPPAGETPLLEVRDLRVRFAVHGGLLLRRIAEVKAVDGVSFNLGRGETLGLVGESGCGKTTLGKAILGLLRITGAEVDVDGHVRFDAGDGKPPVDLLTLDKHAMRPYRAHMQMIFQDPYSSLNPRFTIGQIIAEPLLVHQPNQTAAERRDRVGWLLEKVGLNAHHAARYPHEFSGGQRQRVGIARALATQPKIIIADEPVSALDVSIQAQVINLLMDLQEEFGLSYLFIAHDLSVVRHISDRIAVMYLGNVVEIGPADDVYYDPLHPYTKALLSAVPEPDPERDRKGRVILSGDIPTPLRKPSGCGFRTRCPIARPTCADAVPPLDPKGTRHVACPFV